MFLQQTPLPQHPSQSSSQKQPFVSQDVRNQQYQPTHGVDHGNENQNRHNDHQPAPTPVPNLRSTAVEAYLDNSTSIDDHQPVLNSSTSEIKKDCECILECSTAQAPPVQALSLPAPSVQVPSGPAPWIQAPMAEEAFPAQVPLAQVSLAQALPTQTTPTPAPLRQVPLRQAPPVQVPPVQVPPVQVPPVQVPSVQVPPLQAPPEQVLLVHAPLTRVSSVPAFLVPAPSAPAPSAPAAPITTSFNKPLTALDVGRYNIRTRHNDHQPAPTRIFIPASPTSKIRKDCECIPECLTALAPPAQVLLAQANAPLIQAPLAQVPLVDAPLTKVLSIPAFSVPAPSAQVLPVQAPPVQALPAQVPAIPAPSVPAPLTQAFPVQALSAQAPLVQAPPKQETPAQVQPGQAPPASIPLASNDSGCKQSKKPLEQINIFDAFTVGVTEIAKLLKQDVFKVVTSKQFVSLNEVVTPEKILNASQKGYLSYKLTMTKTKTSC